MNKNSFTGIISASRTSSALKHVGTFETLTGTSNRIVPEIEQRRMIKIMENELTPYQREVIREVCDGKLLTDIARERGVSTSTISRTFHRGIENLRRFLQY